MSRPSPRVSRQIEAFAELAFADDEGRFTDAREARRKLLTLGFDVRPLGTPEGVRPIGPLLDLVVDRIGKGAQ